MLPVINGRMADRLKNAGRSEPVQVSVNDPATIAQNLRARAKADEIKRQMKGGKK